MERHKTLKKPIDEKDIKTLLEDSAKEAYSRPWHRIERGLRLNRLRIFVEDISPQFNMTSEEKELFFIFLQKALDKKLLNTLKVVSYEKETQRIKLIRDLEIKRNPNGLKWGFTVKRLKDGTRKKKRAEDTCISTDASVTNNIKFE